MSTIAISQSIGSFRTCKVLVSIISVLFTSYGACANYNASQIAQTNIDLRSDRNGKTGKPDKPEKPGPGDTTGQGPGPGEISVDGIIYNDLTTASSMIEAGSLVIFGSGVYRNGLLISKDSVTLRGSPGGTHFRGAVIQGKATFVVDGNNVVISNIECSEVAVPDENGACVRQQGKDLTLNYVYFHDSEQGILSADGSGSLTIENSRFERLGKVGRAHAVYSFNDRLEIRYSRFLSSKDQGHEVKSRAPVTLIESSVLASLTSDDSRLVDVPNGGELIIRDSVLEQGPNTSNFQMIGFGLEGISSDTPQSVTLENNIILAERENGNVLLGLPNDYSNISISIINNDIIGENKLNDKDKHNIVDNNQLFLSRESYGLDPFPELPEINGLDTP